MSDEIYESPTEFFLEVVGSAFLWSGVLAFIGGIFYYSYQNAGWIVAGVVATLIGAICLLGKEVYYDVRDKGW